MNNQDTFQKIPVRKKPNTNNKNLWKYNRKLQRKLKLKDEITRLQGENNGKENSCST